MAYSILIWIKQRWRLLFILLVPLLLLPLPIIHKTSEARCGYIVLILTLYWITEVVPLPVTSLLPLILFPMAGILTPEDAAQSYFKDITALFFGSLSLAYAIESVNLHRRVALLVLTLIGTSTKWSMAGIMGVTAFLSMWINNSAATSIMLPVSLAMTEELERHGKEYYYKAQTIKEESCAVNEGIQLSEIQLSNESSTIEVILDVRHIEERGNEAIVEAKSEFHSSCQRRISSQIIKPNQKEYDEIRKGFLLATAYSASIGGLSTVVGTTTNVFAKGFIEDTYENTAFRVNFLNFCLFSLPGALIMLILCWLWLQISYNRKRFFKCRTDPHAREIENSLKLMLREQYKELGQPSWSEYCVSIVFLIMVILWLTQEFGETRGWGSIFPDEYITDSSVAVFCGILPLILPNANPFKSNWKYKPIVRWNDLAKNLPWGVVFILGAGLAVASAFTSSGLSNTVAEALRFLTGVPQAAVILIVIIISGLFTEVTSNLSTASIFLPVLDSVARSSGIHPAFLILPCTLAVSLAFMLPIATPPNAIVFGSGAIRVIDMIKTGIVMNFIGFFVIFLAANTWMPYIYNLNDEATKLFFSVNNTTIATITATMKAGQ